jgi:UDP-GlcNAc:undecaprenyl-phosphate/decaprenyl-phosphate GlcNAc-1-phosphate transferase
MSTQPADVVLATAVATLTAFWVCALLVRATRGTRIGIDETHGVQKFHSTPVPRLGGVGIFLALITGLLAFSLAYGTYRVQIAFLIVAMLPVFGMGLVEDLTRRAGSLSRLLAAMVSGVLGWWLLKAGLVRISWDAADLVLQGSLFAGLLMTVVAAAGSAHALNIIDGAHGLSGFFVIAALGALATIAGGVGDGFVFSAALIAAAATAGFMLWNFPHGRIFLGDAGAYMLGFLIAQLGMILITRHPAVSPWSIMLIMAYPAWETLFSMYRRARGGLRHMGRPDARHLHQLVYRRVFKWAPAAAGRDVRNFRSAATSVLMWPLILLCMVPAVLFWNKTVILFWMCWLFAATYTVLYMTIVRFKVPRTLSELIAEHKRRHEQANPDVASGAAQQVQH